MRSGGRSVGNAPHDATREFSLPVYGKLNKSPHDPSIKSVEDINEWIKKYIEWIPGTARGHNSGLSDEQDWEKEDSRSIIGTPEHNIVWTRLNKLSLLQFNTPHSNVVEADRSSVVDSSIEYGSP